MGGSTTWDYHVVFTRDPETASVVAEIPALQIADFGADIPEALERLQAMVNFHLDCLVQEGKPIPTEVEGGGRALPAGKASSGCRLGRSGLGFHLLLPEPSVRLAVHRRVV